MSGGENWQPGRTVTFQITAPHFCAGGTHTCQPNGAWTVSDCAPIIKYMGGWTGFKVSEYCRKKGWGYAEL